MVSFIFAICYSLINIKFEWRSLRLFIIIIILFIYLLDFGEGENNIRFVLGTVT